MFEDRIFHDGTADAVHLIKPSKNLRPSKSVQSLSAPAKSLRHRRLPRDMLGVAKPSQVEGEQTLLSTLEKSVRSPPTPTKSLRRHKTFQDLRSSTRLASNLEISEKLPVMRGKPKPQHRQVGEHSNVAPLVPLASRTTQKQTPTTDHMQFQLPMRTVSTIEASGPLAVTDSLQPSAGPQLQEIPRPESTNNPILEPAPTFRCKSYDDRMSGNEDPCAVQIRNLNDGIQAPDDFFKPVTRSDPEAPRDIYDPVQRIDVTTWWKDLSPANAEDLFYIHSVFQVALKSILADDVRDMFRTIQQNFVQGKGKSTYLDGFKVAIEDRWVFVEREQLVHVMTERAYEFFSEKQCQPNRSALMQLYLSSTECFLDCARDKMLNTSKGTGVALRTCYDQLSKFEAPTATVGSFCDYVKFLNLNYTPREDEELILIPQYNRDGIFVQSPHPDKVKFSMENPVSWLRWDDDMEGFRGRVPTYSAFPDNFGPSRKFPAVSHVLNIKIHAVFTKHCNTGAVHFEKRIRTLVTLGVLPKISWGAKNSVYGVENQHSLPSSPTLDFAHKPFASPVRYLGSRDGLTHRNLLSSHSSTHGSETRFGHTPHDRKVLTLPKRAPRYPHSPASTSSQSKDGSISPNLSRGEGFTAYPPQYYMPPATLLARSQFSAEDSTTCSEREPYSEYGEIFDVIPYCSKLTHSRKQSCQAEVNITECKLTKKYTEERRHSLLQTLVETPPTSSETRESIHGKIWSGATDFKNISGGTTEDPQLSLWTEDLNNQKGFDDDSSDSEFEDGYKAFRVRASKPVDLRSNTPTAKPKSQTANAHDDNHFSTEEFEKFIPSNDVVVKSLTRDENLLSPIPGGKITSEANSRKLELDGRTTARPIFKELNTAISDMPAMVFHRRHDEKKDVPTKITARNMLSTLRRAKECIPELDCNDAESTHFKLNCVQSQRSQSLSQGSSSSASSDAMPADNFEIIMNNPEVDEYGIVNVNPTCTTTHASPQPFTISSKPSRKTIMEINTLGKRKCREIISNCQEKRSSDGRLGLEEEMALQKAIEKSREEQLQRKMAAQGFEASFDDIFDDGLTELAFDDDSFASGNEAACEAVKEKRSEAMMKAQNDHKEHEVSHNDPMQSATGESTDDDEEL